MRRLLLGGAVAALGWAAVAFLTGGIDTRVLGIAIRARGASRPLAIGLALLAAYAVLERRALGQALAHPARAVAAAAPGIVAALAVITTIDAVRYGAFIASGSDSYGYLSQAYGWARGELPAASPIPLSLPLDSSDWLQTPIGYWPGRLPHTIVPSYAPGLPLLMAAGILVGDPLGPFLVVPIAAGLFVWVTYLLAQRMAGRVAGVAAAALAATSPVVLFLSLWVMSDLPAAAAFTAAGAATLADTRRGVLAAGVLTALGIVIRPNLVPLALLPCLWIFFAGVGPDRFRRLALFVACVAPAALFIAALNTAWYGSPLLSGYGDASARFGLGYLSTNLRHYSAWLVQTQSPWIVVVVVALVPLVRPGPRRAPVLLGWGIFLVTLLCYVTYVAYDAWWYLRFLLPGLGAFFSLVAVGLSIVATRVRRPWGAVAATAIFLLLIGHSVRHVIALDMFGSFKQSEHQYADVGVFAATRLPRDAVFFAMQHSGSIRYYGGRHTVRYDILDAASAARAIAALEDMGLHPYLAIEDGELDLARTAFGVRSGGALPWPPVARMQRFGGRSIYDLATRPSPSNPMPIEPGLAPPYAPPVRVVIEPRKP